MAQDWELDNLKDEQDRAFERQQDAWEQQNEAWQTRQSARDALSQARDRQQEAYESQQSAWERRKAAQDETSEAYDAKQDAYEEQQEAWEELQRLRDSNGPRIGDLKAEHQDMYERTQQLSRDIDYAFSSGNKQDAFDMIEEVKQLRSDMAELPPQWRELSGEINDAREIHSRAAERFRPLQAEFVHLRSISNDAKAEHEEARAEFKETQAACNEAKAEFEDAKAHHENLKDDFHDAKREHQRARDAFSQRLDELRAEQQQRKDDRRSLAQEAGVPSEYWDDVWVSIDNEGTVNIYFGGSDEPAGEGHGHYAMDASGYVTYRRDPGEEHGAHNFTDYEEKPSTVFSEKQKARRPDRTDMWFGKGGFDHTESGEREYGHVTETRHPDGSVTYHYVRDEDENIYIDDSRDD
jgi:chromosome segregation ATPase